MTSLMESADPRPESFRDQIETELECYARYKAQTKNMDFVIVGAILVAAIVMIVIYSMEPDAPLALALIGFLLAAIAVTHLVIIYFMYLENKALLQLLASMDQATQH